MKDGTFVTQVIDTADVVVVGAGVAGLSTAMQLAKRGEPLDFSMTRKPVKPWSPVAALSRGERETLRERLGVAVAKRLAKRETDEGAMPLESHAMLSELDAGGRIFLAETNVEINPQDRLGLAGEG